jgi:hypothetical protein
MWRHFWSDWSVTLGETDRLQALYIPYGGVHFLVNRTQCATSVFAADTRGDVRGVPFFRETIGMGGRRLRLIDLHALLAELFHVTPTEKAQLALLLPLTRLSDRTRRALRDDIASGDDIASREGAPPGGDDLDTDQVALRVSSETVMRSIDPAELRLNGRAMRAHLEPHGVVALHLEAGSFGFLIDLDPILYRAARGES